MSPHKYAISQDKHKEVEPLQSWRGEKKHTAAPFLSTVQYKNQHPHINAYMPVSLGRKSVSSLAMGDSKDTFRGR